MLCLLGVMLSVLCLVSPAPLTTSTLTPCPSSALFKETIQDLQTLRSKGSSKVAPLNNTMEVGGNAATYLEGFIQALKNSKESVAQKLIAPKLKKIQAYGESCTEWTSALKEHHWKAGEENDFFNDLEYFLRFLGQNLPEEKNFKEV